MPASKKIAHKKNTHWPKAFKRQVISDYAVTGSIQACADTYTDTPYDTIRTWIKSDEGVELITTLHDAKTEELRAKYVEGCEAAIDQTMVKLPEASAQQAAVISGVFFDKTRLIDNQATSISTKSDSMATLAATFAKLSQDAIRKQLQDKELIQVIEYPKEPSK